MRFKLAGIVLLTTLSAGRWLSRIRVLPVPPTGPTTSGPGVVLINTQLEEILQR